MSDIYTIPGYLPKCLTEYAAHQFKYDKAQKAINAFERLITYPTMKVVWQKLEQLSKDTQQLEDFLRLTSNHSSLWGKIEDPITEPSDNVQREAYRSIQKDVESIISTLQSLSRVKIPNSESSKQNDLKIALFRAGNVEHGWRVLKEALHRSEIAILKSKVIAQPKQFAQLIFDLNRFDEIANLQDVLETITFATIAASHAKDSNLPKRRNTSKAKTNKFIKDLSDYFMFHFNQPLDELVAITTNVAFDFSDERVTQNMVYKLRNPPMPKPKSKISK